jgi:hypothetical protein
MEQREIKYRNMFSDSIGGWWGSHHPGTLGHVLHWLYVYSGILHLVETVTVGAGKVIYNDKEFIDYHVNADGFLIIDKIYDEKYQFIKENQEVFIQGIQEFGLPEEWRIYASKRKEYRNVFNLQEKDLN